MRINKKISCLVFLLAIFAFQSCQKKDEQTFIPPQQETSVDKEKERLEREEFERLKRLESGDTSSVSDTSKMLIDTSKADTSKSAESKKDDKKKFVQKEKELNKRLDNPTSTINDYIEFLKRGTSEGGNFEQNMQKASQLWESPNVNRFKSNYKDTKKLIVLEEPKVISQKGDEATVEVKIKKIDNKNSKDEELEMTVRYNLVADSKGKWKIKNNTVNKK